MFQWSCPTSWSIVRATVHKAKKNTLEKTSRDNFLKMKQAVMYLLPTLPTELFHREDMRGKPYLCNNGAVFNCWFFLKWKSLLAQDGEWISTVGISYIAKVIMDKLARWKPHWCTTVLVVAAAGGKLYACPFMENMFIDLTVGNDPNTHFGLALALSWTFFVTSPTFLLWT